jgi:cytochrome c oxidase subunit 4
MQAIRLARPRAYLSSRQIARSLSAAAHTSTVTTTTSSAANAVIPLSNVEAQWEKLTAEEQLTVHQQLEELQKRDWKTLSLDEKKAGARSIFFFFFFFFSNRYLQ